HRARCIDLAAGVLALALSWSTNVEAWGNSGHEIIATIATDQLSPLSAKSVQGLLGDETLLSVSTYADKVHLERPETRRWHFLDIPRKASDYVPSRDCPQGDCIIETTRKLWATLADKSAPRGARYDALKFLVNLVGDIHQPLHVTGDNKGQNETRVRFFGRT